VRNILVAVLGVCLAVAAAAQTASKPATAKPAAKPTTAAAAGAKSAVPAPAGTPAEATVDSFIRHYFGYNPGTQWHIDGIGPSDVPGLAEVLVSFSSGGEATQRMRFYVTPDGKHAIVGDAIPFGADPFGEARRTLQLKATGPAQGAAKSTVLIVEFSDLQCPHCKVAFPTLERLIAEEPQARLVYQNFPLPMHPWAQKAAQYADCVAQKNNDAFWKFAGSVFEQQDAITPETADAKFAELATAAGVDGKAVAACAAEPATVARVKQSFDLGRALDVSATPTVFVNGRRISSINALPYDELKAIVEYEIKMPVEK
jgi:protein-disulfide isomerase